ncbi:MAG: S8 family serine peptidase, partial [Verrucomicrobiota bacterium]
GNSGAGGANGLGGAPDTILAPANGKNILTVGALESARQLTNAIVLDTNGVIVRSGRRVIPGRDYVETNETYTTNLIFAAGTDTDYEVASFSSRGNVGIGLEGTAGRFKPDVVAPGAYVLSTRSRDWSLTNNLPADSDLFPVTQELNDEVGPWYRYQSGTSMSAPAISGLLAQMQEYLEVRHGLRIGPDGYKALVINSARVTSPTYRPNPADFLNYAGWGRPDLRRALSSGLASGRLAGGISVPGPGGTNTQLLGVTVTGRSAAGLTSGESRTYRIRFTRPQATNQPIRLTLAWTDPPGNPAAAFKLVNDLDLVVTNISERTVFYGNNLSLINPI